MSTHEDAHDNEWQRGVLGVLHGLMEIVSDYHQFLKIVGGADQELTKHLREIEELYARLSRHISHPPPFGEAA